jgi:hypothetical protein
LGRLKAAAGFGKNSKLKTLVAEPKQGDDFRRCVEDIAKTALKTALKDGGELKFSLAPPNAQNLIAPPILADDAAPLALVAAPEGKGAVAVRVTNKGKTPYTFTRSLCGMTTLRVLGNGLRPLAADELLCPKDAKGVDAVIAPGATIVERVEVRAREGFKHMSYLGRIALVATKGNSIGLVCSNQFALETDTGPAH